MAIEADFDSERDRSWRRPGLWLVLLILAAAFGYWLSPYLSVARFAQAADAGSVEEVLARTDIPALRRSVARQVVRSYITGDPQARSLDPLARNVVAGVAASYLDAILAEQVTPEALAGLLRHEAQPGSLLGEGVTLPRINRLSEIWDVFARSGFDGLTSVVIIPPPGKDGEYRLRFSLSGWRWRLRAVELPEPVVTRLVNEFKARREAGR